MGGACTGYKKLFLCFLSKTLCEDDTRNSHCVVNELLFHMIKAFNSVIASSVQIMKDMMPQIITFLPYIVTNSTSCMVKQKSIRTTANLQVVALIRNGWKNRQKNIYFCKLVIAVPYTISIMGFYFLTKIYINFNFIQACHLKCGFNTTNLRLICGFICHHPAWQIFP